MEHLPKTQILHYEHSLNLSLKVEILLKYFSDRNNIKPKFSNKKIGRKILNDNKLSDVFLSNLCIKKEKQI